jgi:hypothetical protein
MRSRGRLGGQRVVKQARHSTLPFGPERLDLNSSTGLTAEGLMALHKTEWACFDTR